jgi:hypothetical protein
VNSLEQVGNNGQFPGAHRAFQIGPAGHRRHQSPARKAFCPLLPLLSPLR